MRILSDGASPPPTLAAGDAEIGITIERDPERLRGTGGVLHDICDAYDDDDYVLVATAAQVLVEPLGDLASALLRSGGDFALIAHHDATPISLMLLRCGALRQISDRGFVDMKEQVLPKIAATRPTSVLTRRQPVGLPVRTLREYTQALHFNQQVTSGAGNVHDPFAETWASRVAIVERGATVHRSAHLHDSVVLVGGCVEESAVVVRSVVCPGGVVRGRQTAIDSLVTPRKVRR
jgi:hypothetical protein